MNTETHGYACIPVKENRIKVGFRTARHAVQRWLFLNIWCRHCYRHVMRFAHRFGWHYAPAGPMPEPTEKLLGYLTEKLCWCQWCGLRGRVLTARANQGSGMNL